ncbi:MAG: glycosyltransferase family 2 protein [Methylovulum sp.]|nr:glycosyltransferase family 2 protein [Methylovulum sp.]
MPKEIVVYASVLNWNKAEATLECLEQLFKANNPDNLTTEYFVVDNGSGQDDFILLSKGLKNYPVTFIRLESNLGFSGGHNIVMQKAIDNNADYVWLVNNDGIALPDTLSKIVELAEADPTCGAVSPLIVRHNDENIIDFCGAYHNWEKLELVPLNSNLITNNIAFNERNMWLVGAAILFRIKALKQVGLLDDRFFAYFEDNDICAKLASYGWKNKVANNARFFHDVPTTRQPYFYYLTTRNDFLFWLKHTPKGFRRFIWLRLIDRAIYRANKLAFEGEKDKSNACLLGCLDGILGNGGKPNLNRKVPLLIILLKRILWIYYAKEINKIKN